MTPAVPAPFAAACLQATTRRAGNDPARGAEVVLDNARHFAGLAAWARRRIPDLRLVVLPEFSLTGSGRKTIPQWTAIAPTASGPALEILGEAAVREDLYVCLATYEYDPDWPGRFWNTAFLLGPEGRVLLRYRKINDVNHGQTVDTTPGDVWTDYRARYGVDGTYPVVETDIGRIGAMICYDVTWPEVARGLALHGADLLLQPTSEPHGGAFGGPQTTWDDARQLRAWENGVYLVSANSGETVSAVGQHFSDDLEPVLEGGPVPEMTPLHFSRGFAVICGPDGRVLGRTTAPGEAVCWATIDLARVRQRRPSAQVAQLRPQDYAETLRQATTCCFPADHWRATPIQHRDEGVAVTMATIQRLEAAGIVRREAIPEPFQAVLVQAPLAVPAGPDPVSTALDASLALAAEALAEVPDHPRRLVLLPIGFAQGPLDPALTSQQALTADDERLLGRVGGFARQHGCWVAGGILERTPDGVTAAGLLWDPRGSVILHERQRHPWGTTLPRPLDGRIRAVAETRLGRIGLLLGRDADWPEAGRRLALQGAEILVHLDAQDWNPDQEQQWRARRVRAWESCAWFLAVNAGETVGGDGPAFAGPGMSQVIDDRGDVLAVIDAPGPAWLAFEVDPARLVPRRTGINMNFLAQYRADVYRPLYEEAPVLVRSTRAGPATPG